MARQKVQVETFVLNDEGYVFLLYDRDQEHLTLPAGEVGNCVCADVETLESGARDALEKKVAGIKKSKMYYAGYVETTSKDGTQMITHQFATKANGTPTVKQGGRYATGFSGYTDLSTVHAALSPDLQKHRDEIMRRLERLRSKQ